MRSRVAPLIAPRRLKVGPRRALALEECLDHGVTVLEPHARVLRTYVPAVSYTTYEYLMRTLLLWAFDFPGAAAPWSLMHRHLERATDVLSRYHGHGMPALEAACSGADRYALGERFPAALLTCLTIDALADLCCHTVAVQDDVTAYEHTWTIWSGALLQALWSWQSAGCLPEYAVTQTRPQALPSDRVLLASRVLLPSLWSLLGKDLLRWLAAYILDPHGPLTPLSRYLCTSDGLTAQYLDAFLAACLTGQLRVNTLPGQVFTLPLGTFCAIPRTLAALESVAGEPQEQLMSTLQQAGVMQAGVYTLTIPAESQHGKAVTLVGVLIPHSVLQARCLHHPRYKALPWAATPLPMYAAATHLIRPKLFEEPGHAQGR